MHNLCTGKWTFCRLQRQPQAVFCFRLIRSYPSASAWPVKSLIEYDGANLADRRGLSTPHHRSCSSPKRSVAGGCYVCNQLRAALTMNERCPVLALSVAECRSSQNDDALGKEDSTEASPSNSAFETLVTELNLEDGSSYGYTGNYRLDVAFHKALPGKGRWSSVFFLQPPDGNGFVNYNSTKELGSDTKSAGSLSFARKWVADCMANHKQCDNMRAKNSYGQCRLIETSTADFHGPSRTLSHRWGLASCMQLTKENYTRLLDGFPVTVLPQLYQDAVYAVREFRIQYLWTNSLCIVHQGDDGSELRKELVHMSEVYLNSHHSLFHSRDQHALQPEIINLFFNGHSTQFLISDLGFWDTDVSHSFLNTRAWDAAENYPDGRFKTPLPSSPVRTKKNLDNIASYNDWAEVVRAYRACDLTFPSDKLATISAIARIMGSILDDDYVAGMWRRYLERELLWSKAHTAVRPGTRRPPTTLYGAPTWSWAAVDGVINPGLPDVGDSDVLISVEGLGLGYAWEDSTSVLKQLVFLPHSSSTHGDWNMVVNGLNISVLADPVRRELQPYVFLDHPDVDDFDTQNAEGALYCIPARVRNSGNGSIYILLLELYNKEKGVFHRIGLARGWGTAIKERIMDCGVHVDEYKFPCEDYCNGRHTICVV
ncbi:heterokaryon incompatibility protein [Xylaria cf. heliscus]|nr:heterokaryon incompatibility protein [Xylaria cf. heliscus]